MLRINPVITSTCLAFILASIGAVRGQGVEDFADQWHQWRGPEANGVSKTAKPPIEWSDTKNIRWKVSIEGQGNSTPIVWKDQVFVLTAINTGEVDPNLPKPEDQPKRVFGITYPNTTYQMAVISLDRETGKENWRRIAT